MHRVLTATLEGGQFQEGTAGNTKRMKSIRSGGNRSTEKRLRAALVGRGITGWQVRPQGLPGKPDFVFPASNTLVFVDGCFWHGCRACGYSVRKNGAYWNLKIRLNVERDRKNKRRLQRMGYTVLRVWEHELANDLAACVQRILDAIEARS